MFAKTRPAATEYLEVPAPASEGEVWWLVERQMLKDPAELLYTSFDFRLDYCLPAIDADAERHGGRIESRRLSDRGIEDDMVFVYYRMAW